MTRHHQSSGARVCTVIAIPVLVSLVQLTSRVYASSTPVSIAKEDVIFVPAPFVHLYEVIQTVQLQANRASDVTLPLPSGAKGLQVVGLPKSAWQLTNDGVTVRGAVKANGTGRVTLTYTIPQDSGQGASITLTSPYPVTTAHLYMPIGNSALSAPSLQAATQTVTISGTLFRVFSRLGIQPGEQWPIGLQELPAVTKPVPTNGLPVIGSSDDGASNAIGAVVNIIIAVIVLAVGFIGLRSTRGSRMPKTPEQALLQAWTTVEQQYASGTLEPDEYARRRGELKRKLVTLRLGDPQQADR